MHHRVRGFVAAALFAMLAACTNLPPASAPADTGTRPGPTATATDDHPERAFRKGMTAAQVKQIMGEPAEVRPRTSPTGNAEMWVYNRTVRGPTTQVQVGTRPITVSVQDGDGVFRQRTIGQEPIYRQAHDKIDETIMLLMFDGRLVEQATTTQKHQEFE